MKNWKLINIDFKDLKPSDDVFAFISNQLSCRELNITSFPELQQTVLNAVPLRIRIANHKKAEELAKHAYRQWKDFVSNVLEESKDLQLSYSGSFERTKLVEIDASQFKSKKEFYAKLNKEFKCPPYSGENADAFWDSLTGEAEIPERVIIRNWAVFEEAFPEVAKVFQEIVADYMADWAWRDPTEVIFLDGEEGDVIPFKK